MDDLIVIILTIIIMIAGAIGQIKKKPVQNAKVKDTEPRDNEDIWFLPGEPEITDHKKQTVRDRFEDHLTDRMPENLSSYKFRDDYSNFRSETEMANVIAKKDTSQVKKRKFPLKKAVIFSEILNRKYT